MRRFRERSRLEGFREASKQMGDMKRATARNVGKRSLDVPAEILARAVRDNIAPHNLTGATYESTDVHPFRQRGIVARQVLVSDEAIIQLEYGNSDQAPTPVVGPAVEAKRQEMDDSFALALQLEVDAQVIRNAKRAARGKA